MFTHPLPRVLTCPLSLSLSLSLSFSLFLPISNSLFTLLLVVHNKWPYSGSSPLNQQEEPGRPTIWKMIAHYPLCCIVKMESQVYSRPRFPIVAQYQDNKKMRRDEVEEKEEREEEKRRKE
jgi:hypothetical protein